MRFVTKIVWLILIQIIVIITSFLVVAYLESQNSLVGHTINVAGKNRVLASQVETELHGMLFQKNMQEDNLDTHKVMNAVRNLDENIRLLKHGGNISDNMIPPLPPQFSEDWQNVTDVFVQYQSEIMELSMSQEMTLQDVEDANKIGDKLISYSDTLTDKLSHKQEISSLQLVMLQIWLGIANVGIHIFMIWLILRIFSKSAKEKSEKEKFTMLGEFAAGLAHDMRTPMGTIYNSVNLISNQINDQSGRKEIDRINRSVKRMSHQIDGILNYVKTPRLDLELHSVKKILDICMKDLRIPDNIKMNMPKMDATIYCDGKNIEFVFTNLILNAIQAIGGRPGYITITIKEADTIILSFENSGGMIPEDHLENIFDPLYTTKMHGTGLGLTSCRNIIREHNGTISASNDPVTFTLSLPRHNEKDSLS